MVPSLTAYGTLPSMVRPPVPTFGDIRISAPIEPNPDHPTDYAYNFGNTYVTTGSSPTLDEGDDLIIVNGFPVGTSQWAQELSDQLRAGTFINEEAFRDGVKMMAIQGDPDKSVTYLPPHHRYYVDPNTPREEFGYLTAKEYWKSLKPWLVKVADSFDYSEVGTAGSPIHPDDLMGNTQGIHRPAWKSGYYKHPHPLWYRVFVPEFIRKWIAQVQGKKWPPV